MINIVTGKRNSGKTTHLKNFYEKSQKGAGFLSIKIFDNQSQHIGYNLLNLKTKIEVPFIRQIQHIPEIWNEKYKFGTYSFSIDGFKFAESIINNCQEEPIFIDEIGLLEISEKKGFFNLLINNIHKDIYFSIRDIYIEDAKKIINIVTNINTITIQ